jgi:pentatricopeptide repeat protein
MLSLRQIRVFCSTSCLSKRGRRWTSTSTSTSTENGGENVRVFAEQKRGPWNFKSSTYKSQSFSGSLPMRQRKEQLAKMAERGQLASALEMVNKWKKLEDFKPDLDIYNSLLALCATSGLPNDARAFLADMLLMGIEPDTNSFYHLLRVSVLIKHFSCLICNFSRAKGSVVHTSYMKFST